MTINNPARFAFVDDDRELRLGVFDMVAGLFTGHTAAESYFEFVAASEWFPVEFTASGLRPQQPLIPGKNMGWCAVEILSDADKPIGHYAMGATKIKRLNPRADGSFDAIVTGRMTKPPERGVESIWDRWRTGPPETVNAWAQLPAGQREAWLEVVSMYRWRDPLKRGVRYARPGEKLPILNLDGRYVTDLASVYCAIGETVNGPGGYYGSNPYALRDCLRSGEPNSFGLQAPFILVWQAYEVALQHVDEGLSVVLDVLTESGVQIEKQ